MRVTEHSILGDVMSETCEKCGAAWPIETYLDGPLVGQTLCDGCADLLYKAHTESIDHMRARHRREIETLQAVCPHPENSQEWFEEFWAPGHSSGRMILVCRDCEASLEYAKPSHDDDCRCTHCTLERWKNE